MSNWPRRLSTLPKPNVAWISFLVHRSVFPQPQLLVETMTQVVTLKFFKHHKLFKAGDGLSHKNLNT